MYVQRMCVYIICTAVAVVFERVAGTGRAGMSRIVVIKLPDRIM